MTSLPDALATQRFILALRTSQDLADLLDLDDDPDVIRYVGPTSGRPEREAYWRECFENADQSPVFVIRSRTTQEFMGWAFLRPYKDNSGDWELGYRLKKAAWGQGIGTEACKALMAWAHQQPAIDTIVAVYEYENTASLSIMKKLGMTQMGERHYPNEGPLPYCALSRPR
jgi:RimJ/RimL family protein N-acetyltransferase